MGIRLGKAARRSGRTIPVTDRIESMFATANHKFGTLEEAVKALDNGEAVLTLIIALSTGRGRYVVEIDEENFLAAQRELSRYREKDLRILAGGKK